MANRKKKPPFNSTIMLIGALIILILGAVGVKVPDALQDLFNVQPQTTTPSSTPAPKGDNPGPIENGKATFSAEELKDSSNGWITYHSLDRLKRATGADALLKPAMVNTGTSANKDIRPAGFISGKANHSRGHLIGRQMGGSGDDPRNLTTLYQNPVNTPYMTKYENQIRAALDRGETVRYRVTPVYNGNDLLAEKIILEAKSLKTNSPIDFSETDVEHWRKQEFLVVAQSLDGDYLAGTLEQTFVIPSSLYKEDIEQFDKQLIDFFIAYENKEITSAILPKEL